MCTSSRGRTRPPPRASQSRCQAPEHTAGNAADAQAGHIFEAVGLVGEDRARCTQPATDGRTYALPEIARGEPGGIPRDEGVVAAHDVYLAAQVVAEATRIVLRSRRQPLPECGDEVRPVSADILAACLESLGDGADADVQPAALLRHVPGVPRQPLLEEPQVAVSVAPVVLDLVLESHDLQLARARIELAEELAVHRAARAPGADQVTTAQGVIDQVPAVVGADVAYVVLHDLRARALEEPRVELETAD